MCVFITKLAKNCSLVGLGVLFLHRTFRVHEVRTLRSTKQVDHRRVARRPVQLNEIVLVKPHRIRVGLREVRMELIAARSLFGRVR